jgi:HSP20 family protein
MVIAKEDLMTLMRQPLHRQTMPLRSALERVFGDWPVAGPDGSLTEMAPALDVRETDNAYIIEVDLPGMDPKETEVLVEGRMVTIRGRRRIEQERQEGGYLVRERRAGEFIRAVALPGMVDVDEVTSRFENGQLTITLPKEAQSRPRRIEIDAGQAQADGAPSGKAEADTSGQAR